MKPKVRPFNTSTKLGQMMLDAGLNVAEVFYATEISHRTLSDYLAGRQAISNKHMVRLCALFECDVEDLQESKGAGHGR
jgi:DNA-binding Xre family transcriptional regulator